MAAPHVAGVAALMASANPRLSAAELRALLLEHAVRSPEAGPAGRGRGAGVGRGRHAHAARTRSTSRRRRASSPRRRPRDALRVQYRLEGTGDPRRARSSSTARRSRRRPASALARARSILRGCNRPPPGAGGARRRRPRRRHRRRARRRAPRPRRAPRCGSPARPPPARRSPAAEGRAAGHPHRARRRRDRHGHRRRRARDRRRRPDEPRDLPRRPARARLHAVRDSATAAWSPTACRPSSRPKASRPPRRRSSSRTSGPSARCVFASSADAAAYVRATPGAWGYVDPRRQRRPAGRPVPLLSARDRHPRGPGRAALAGPDAHDRRTVGAGYAHRRDGRAAHRARDPGRQPPLPRRGGGLLRRQVGHLVRRDRPPAGAGQAHQAARPEAGPVRALAGDRRRARATSR